MNRLTRLDKQSGEFTISENTSYEDAMCKLHEYEEAEEQGLIVKLPCRVGDKIWVLSNENFVFSREINHVEVYEDEIIFCEAGVDGDICSWNNIVKSTPNYCDAFFFLAEAEALQALKERERE